MGKTILGFAAGAVFASLAFLLFDLSPQASSERVGGIAPLSPLAPDPARDVSSGTQLSSTADASPAARSTEAVSSVTDLPEDLTQFAMRDDLSGWEVRDLLSVWSDAELRALQQRAQSIAERSLQMQTAERVSDIVGGEIRRRERIAGWADAPPPDLPIVLPPEFNRLLENATTNDFHERLQREPFDSAWSRSMATSLSDFFTSRPQIAGTFGSPTINCRVSACEIAIVAYGFDAASRAIERGTPNAIPELVVETDFRRATTEIHEQPWADQFRLNVSSPSISIQDGVTTILWHLFRDEN